MVSLKQYEIPWKKPPNTSKIVTCIITNKRKVNFSQHFIICVGLCTVLPNITNLTCDQAFFFFGGARKCGSARVGGREKERRLKKKKERLIAGYCKSKCCVCLVVSVFLGKTESEALTFEIESYITPNLC